MSTSVRQRLEAQGFYGLDDAALREIGPWLRWSPALCTLSMLAGVGLASPAILWALAATAFLGCGCRSIPSISCTTTARGISPAPGRCRIRAATTVFLRHRHGLAGRHRLALPHRGDDARYALESR